MDEVRAVWGAPDKVETFIPIEEEPSCRDIDWIFSNGYELCFDSEESFLLTAITCVNENVTLSGFQFIGLTPKELILKFPKIEFDGEFQLAIDEYKYVEMGLSFYSKDGHIYAVTLFPEYTKDNQDILWPNPSQLTKQ